MDNKTNTQTRKSETQIVLGIVLMSALFPFLYHLQTEVAVLFGHKMLAFVVAPVLEERIKRLEGSGAINGFVFFGLEFAVCKVPLFVALDATIGYIVGAAIMLALMHTMAGWLVYWQGVVWHGAYNIIITVTLG